MPEAEEAFDPGLVLERFAAAGVDFVVIGGVAGAIHGSSFGTFDVDLAYSREPENLEKVAEVLRSLDAELRGTPAGLPFLLDAQTLKAGANFTFTTSLGSIDLLGDPAGAPPYERLRKAATVVSVRGHEVRVASLDHLIAMKEAAGRPKDKLQATEYRTISDELRAPREA
ncbi:MAG: nucleotidyltransferase [Gaiellaceae bacterium]